MRKFLFIMSLFLSCCRLACGQEADTDKFLRGVTNYSQERFAAAGEIFSGLHRDFPADDAVSYYLGLTEFALGQVDSSEAHLRLAVSQDSTNIWYWEALASLYSSKGERSSFAAICEKLLELNPSQYNNPYTLTVVGDEMMNRRADAKALEYYDRALELDPDYAPAELGRLEILRFQGNFPPFFLTLDHFVRNDLVRLLVRDLHGVFVNDGSFLFRVGKHGFRARLHLPDFFVEIGVLFFDLPYFILPLLDHPLDGLEQQKVQPYRENDQRDQMHDYAFPLDEIPQPREKLRSENFHNHKT